MDAVGLQLMGAGSIVGQTFLMLGMEPINSPISIAQLNCDGVPSSVFCCLLWLSPLLAVICSSRFLPHLLPLSSPLLALCAHTVACHVVGQSLA